LTLYRMWYYESQDDLGTQAPSNIPIEQSPLIGTSWTAVEIAFNDETNTTVSLSHPITLSFNSDSTYGSTGCNRYFGTPQQLSQHSFSTSNFRLTRMYCRDVMDQERSYMRFFRNRKFYFNIVSSENDEDELILLDDIPDAGEENILARFCELDGDVK